MVKKLGLFLWVFSPSNHIGKALNSVKHEHDRLVFILGKDQPGYHMRNKAKVKPMRPIRRWLLWAEAAAVPNMVKSHRIYSIIW